MAKSDPYYGRTQTPINSNDARRGADGPNSNVRIDEKFYNNGRGEQGRPKTLGLVGLSNIGNTCFMYLFADAGTRRCSAC